MLNFGHRLSLLKQAWGFSISADFTTALGRGKTISSSTIHKWFSSKGIDRPQHMSAEEATDDLRKFFSEKGYFERFDVKESQFVDAMLDKNDMKFINFLAGASKEPLPVPASLRRINNDKSDALRRKMLGKFVLYRLGVEARRMGRTVIMRGAKNVLRRVPVQIENGERYLKYSESYLGNESKGFVFLIDTYITVWGEDADREGFSELFLSHITLETNDHGMHDGVITMDGDMGIPTAYRIVMRRVPDEDQGISWEKFVEKYEKTVELTAPAGEASLKTDDVEEETNKPYQNYIDLLGIENMKTDLQN